MAQGFTGTILRVDLTARRVDRQPVEADWMRAHLGGSALGTWFLLKETPPDLDPLDPRNVLVIAPSVTTGAPVSGASRCCFVALSPVTGAVGDSQAGGEIGPAVKRAGYDAIVVTGQAADPVYLVVDGEKVEIRDARHIAGRGVADALDSIVADLAGKETDWSVVQCGPAGERRVRFASLQVDRADTAGRTGMGAVFGSKNLRAVAVSNRGKVAFSNSKGLIDLNRRAAERLKRGGFPGTLHEYGTPGVVKSQAESGNFATRNHSRGIHPDYARLDASSFAPTLAAGSKSCYACVVGCRKKVRAETPWRVTNRLGGPEFETLGMLGSNLAIADPVAVARANEICNDMGLDTITMGGIAAFVVECMERGLVSPEAVGGPLRFGDPEGIFWLIERVARREGVGETLAGGFEAAIRSFGEATRPYAVQVKNQGFPVHMPQVKPSQALMYAVCPIGPDHQSSEHDWLIEGSTEECLGLGIPGRGDRTSTDLAKVRMTVYSQFYYSLLDALSLCMFCWGPGCLFTYRDLEDLVRDSTGWQATFWELMKVGERRVAMMRQMNARRGFTRAQDVLPPRVLEPLPDGPSAGRHVEHESFARMLEEYYGLVGWDPETGNPTRGKLMELGLEWTIA